jgi:hypothetical protein
MHFLFSFLPKQRKLSAPPRLRLGGLPKQKGLCPPPGRSPYLQSKMRCGWLRLGRPLRDLHFAMQNAVLFILLWQNKMRALFALHFA